MFLVPDFGMKRESGVIPGLSRSCKLQNRGLFYSHFPLQDGKTGPRGVSQKTCHKHIIHSFRGLKLG